MFGSAAFQILSSVECSPKGYYNTDPKLCQARGVDGFPTFGNLSKKGSMESGEMRLKEIVALSGFNGTFDDSLEPVVQGGGSCGV